jgi:hypothetical protein
MHPLYGRRFAVVYRSSVRHNRGYFCVVYDGDMRLSIPIQATALGLPRQNLGTKLTLESVTELVTLVEHSEVLCQSLPVRSGSASAPPNELPSAKT